MEPSNESVGDEPQRQQAQLLRFLERTLMRLEALADDLSSESTKRLVRALRRRTGASRSTGAEVVSAVEDAIRNLKVWESEVLLPPKPAGDDPEVGGVANLPAFLARFISDRKELPGFTYTVSRDEERGWVIRWKEFTAAGEIRGSGQFYERPYAWLED